MKNPILLAIQALQHRRARLDHTIQVLSEEIRNGARPALHRLKTKTRRATKKTGRPPLSPAERRALSHRMKQQWALLRKRHGGKAPARLEPTKTAGKE